ncbi:titin-like [Apodemus sylvaticus]|uniref:titin-like n=1 Tax=Apodemus sylvaticus TaxID=10129 RepID=UPI002242653F|nr:titin-like [Apodemus sylvaticus]
MSLLHFGARKLLFTWQLFWLLAPAVPIPEFTGNPVQLTSESWVPTKLWSWHPSDHPPKAAHTRISKTEAGGVDHLGSSVSTEMLSPLEELTDSLLPFQDPSTFRELNPESEELVSHKDLTDKLIPTGKQPGNNLMLSGDQNQASTLPLEFKSTASLVGAADNQLYDILVPTLDSQSSKATTFIVSPKELKKDLAQHKKPAKVVGKPQFQKQIMDDYYEDLTMNKPHSYNLPLQSQENAGEAPELLEQVELNQMGTQTRNPENFQQEAPDYFSQSPEEDEPLIQKEDSAHHQLHYTLPTITGKPVDTELKITSEPIKEVESSPYEEETPTQTPGPLVGAELYLSQQQQPAKPSETPEEGESSVIDLESSVQPQEDSEALGPLPTQQEDLSQHLGPVLEDESSLSELEQPLQLSESPEEVGSGSENQPEASVQPTVLPLAEQEAPFGAPESPIETVVETSPIHEIQPTQNEDYQYHLPNVTVRPVAVMLTITSEPIKEIDSFLVQQEFPVHTLEYSNDIEPFLKEEEPPAQVSESLGESQFESQLEVPVQASEYDEEFKSSAAEQLAQFPENHEVTVFPSDRYPAQQSSLSDVTGQPSDLDITITENPIEMVTSVYHDAAAAPEEVEFLINQQGVPSQSLEPILYDKPLSQQEDTTGISQISEEGESFPAQQETLDHSLEMSTEEIAQPPGHHEVTGSPLGHGQVYSPTSQNILTQYPTSPEEDQYSPVGQGVPNQLEELSVEPSPSQQNSAWPSVTDMFLSPADLEAIFRATHSESYKTTIKHEDLVLSITPEPSMEDGSILFPQEDLLQPIDSTEQGEFSHIKTSALSKPPYFSNTEALSFQEAIAETTHNSKQVDLSSMYQEAPELPPGHTRGLGPSLYQQITQSHLKGLHENLKLFPVLKPTAAQALKPWMGTFSLIHNIIPHYPPKPLKNMATHIPGHKMTVPRPDQDQGEYAISSNGSFQSLDLEVTVTSGITPEDKHILPNRTVNPQTNSQVKIPHSQHVETQHSNPAKTTVQPLDLELAINLQPTPKENFAQTLQETTTQMTGPPKEVIAQAPEHHEGKIPIPTQDQAEYSTSPTVSFQPLDPELTITSEATREPHHPSVPQQTIIVYPPKQPLVINSEQVYTQPPNPTEATVQPLNLDLNITSQPTAEGELPQTLQDSTTQILEPPTVVLVPVPIYQEVTVQTSQYQAEYPPSPTVSFQPLDLKLTTTPEATRETHYPTVPQQTIIVHPPKHPLVIYSEQVYTQLPNPTETTVQPLDLELNITLQPTAEAESSQSLQDNTSQIGIEPPIEVVALVPIYQEVTVQVSSQDQTEYPTPSTVSFQPLDLKLTITSETTREPHHPTVPQQTIIVHPPKHPLVINSEQVHIQHPNSTETTVQPLGLELTITPQPTAEGELPQTLQDSTTQVTEPPTGVVIPVPVDLEVTVPTLSQDQTEYPTSSTVSFQPLGLELTVTPEPTRQAEHFITTKKTTAFPPKYTHMTLPQQVPVQHLKPIEGIVQPLDLEFTIAPQLTAEGELSETVQESTTQITEPHKEIVVPVPLYQELIVPPPSEDQAEYRTSFQPLDLELTITSEPTKEAYDSKISKKTVTVHFPKNPLVMNPEHVHTQHPNPAEVTDKPLGLELTVSSSRQPTAEGEHFQSMQETTTQISEPPKQVVTPGPEYQEVALQAPIQEQAKYLLSPTVSFHTLDLELTVSSEPPREAHHMTTPDKTMVPLPKYPLGIYPGHVHTQHLNPTDVTSQPLNLELTVNPQPNTEEEHSQTIQKNTIQITEPAKEDVALAPEVQDMTIPMPVLEQTEAPTPQSMSLQSMDQELTLLSDPPDRTDHPPDPKETKNDTQGKIFLHYAEPPMGMVVEPPDLFFLTTIQSKPVQETTTEITKSTKEVAAHTIEYKEGVFSAPVEGQAKSPTLPNISLQPLDQELTLSSQPSGWPHRPPYPNEPGYPTPGKIYLHYAEPPRGMVVEPPDLFFLKTTKSKPAQENPAQIPKSPKEVADPTLEYKEGVFLAPVDRQAKSATPPNMLLQPLDQELTLSSQPSGWPHRPPYPNEPGHPTPGKIYLHYAEPPRGMVVEPPDLFFLKTTKSKPVQETLIHITKSSKEMVPQSPEYKEAVLPDPVEGQDDSPTPPNMSLQRLDQEPIISFHPRGLVQDSPNAKETKKHTSGKIFLHYAEPPRGMVVEPPDLFFLKTTKSKPGQENPTQMTKSPEEVAAHTLDYRKRMLLTPDEGQTESTIPFNMSLQPLDQELTLSSQPPGWPHHLPNPNEPGHPTPGKIYLHYAEPPRGMVVEPPDLFFLKTTKSKPGQENPTQIAKSHKEIISQSPKYRDAVLPDPGVLLAPVEGQPESETPPNMSLQPLDQELTLSSQPSGWPHRSPYSNDPGHPTPGKIYLHYAEPPRGMVVEPPDLFFLKTTKSKPQIPKLTKEVAAPTPAHEEGGLLVSVERQAKSANPPKMSLQPLDQELTLSSQPSGWPHRPPYSIEPGHPTPGKIYLHYAEPPRGMVVEPPDLFFLKTTKSKPGWETPPQITKSPTEVGGEMLEYEDGLLSGPIEGQGESPPPPSMSLQLLDQELTISSQPSGWPHHPPYPNEPGHPTPGKIYLHYAEPPRGMVVEPPDLFFLKTTKSKPAQENPAQIPKSPKEVEAPTLEYKEGVLLAPVDRQAKSATLPNVALQPLDQELTLSFQPSGWPHRSPYPNEPGHPTPGKIYLHYAEPPRGMVVEPPDLFFLKTTKSKPGWETPTQITKSPNKVGGGTLEYEDGLLSGSIEGKGESPPPPSMSLLPLDQELTLSSQPSGWPHRPPYPNEPGHPIPGKIYLHYAEPPRGMVVEPPDLFD